MKNYKYVYINTARNAIVVLDEYGRAMAITGREVDFAIADAEQTKTIRRRLTDPEYKRQMITEPIGVYKEYNGLHLFLTNVLNWIFGVKTK